MSSAKASPASERGIARFINDPRDAPFVALMAACTLVIIPFAIVLYIPGVFRWWLGLAYFALNFLGFLDRYILMLHNTSHRVLFRPRYRLLNLYIPWVLGPFFGETPETYFAHHVGMHHPENNLEEDLSTTMPFQRDSVLDFLTYYGRFITLAMVELARYLDRKKRVKLRLRMVSGELAFVVLCVALSLVNWRATLVVFILPVIAVRFLMMAGNWGQHAFLDAADPASPYKNSITCLADRYNRRCFNDGYHIGHHIKANRHWTEMPADFEANREAYAREGAIVFKGIDFFGVWMLLMFKNYRGLARHYLPLDGRERSVDEIAEMLRSRTSPIVREPSIARSVTA